MNAIAATAQITAAGTFGFVSSSTWTLIWRLAVLFVGLAFGAGYLVGKLLL